MLPGAQVGERGLWSKTDRKFYMKCREDTVQLRQVLARSAMAMTSKHPLGVRQEKPFTFPKSDWKTCSHYTCGKMGLGGRCGKVSQLFP